jgi:glycosyltransferase involved in cell wall biosynthesis
VVAGEVKAAWLAGARLFVLPSRHEPFSNALLEALAAGLPVVASDVDGNRELCGDGHACRYPAESDETLATIMAELLRNPETAAQMGSAARTFAEGYSWDVVIAEYERLYLSLVA